MSCDMVDRQRVKLLALEAKEQENIMMRDMASKYSEEDNAKAIGRQVQCIIYATPTVYHNYLHLFASGPLPILFKYSCIEAYIHVATYI